MYLNPFFCNSLMKLSTGPSMGMSIKVVTSFCPHRDMDTRIIEKMNKDSLFIIGSYYTSTPQSYTFSLSFPSNVADIFYLIVPPSKHHQRGGL